MKLAAEALKTVKAKSDVVPGNIYPAKGGRSTPGTEYWLVIAVYETGAHVIGFDAEGNPVSTASYGKHALRERPLLGKADLSKLTIEVVK